MERKKKNNSIARIPTFDLAQSAVESNTEIMKKMLNVIINKGVSATLTTEKRGNYKINVKGIENIFNNLFPLLVKYSHFLY